MKQTFFKHARPVFLAGCADRLNTFASFRAVTPIPRDAVLYITASTFYRLKLNGILIAFGPARTAKGYARVDEIPLGTYAYEGTSEIVIEVAGYACASLSTVRQSSFLITELRTNNSILLTSEDFTAYEPSQKLREVRRYSYQRHFGEVWDMRNGNALLDSDRRPLEVLDLDITFLPRTAPYPYYGARTLTAASSVGTLTYDETRPYRANPYSVFPLPDGWGSFDQNSIRFKPYQWISRHRQAPKSGTCSLPVTLRENEYAIMDFERIECGFMQATLCAYEESEVILAFSEDGAPEQFSFTNMNAETAWVTLLAKGQKLCQTTFEPYTFRYVMVAVKRGAITLDALGVIGYTYDMRDAAIPACDDPVLNAVCRGAARTFAHNAVDLYMDCPSRERAGWLCDSYFTAKTEYALFGKVPLEDAYLENFRLYRNEGAFPDGVLPMCYPSDPEPYKNGFNKFIPQWNMWYVIELADYLTKRNPEVDRELYRESVERFMAFLKGYENEDGLLERLPSWNFVEWSSANNWTWDVNYPTNFLYAKTLESYYRIFGDERDLKRSREVQKTAEAQAFGGEYFMDHAIRDENGKLILQKDSSEAGQYYAILFGDIDLSAPKYRELYRLVTEVFAAKRRAPKPEILEINAFIGVYLRLEALQKLGEYDLLLRDIKEFFGAMEVETGTLWEYRQRNGSRDHGFASYALVAIQNALKHKHDKQ